MAAGFEQLDVIRIQKAFDALQDVRDKPQDLLFYNRTPMVPARDGEIMARYIGRAQIADLVADDGVAGTYSLGKFTTYTHEPPNIKVGTNLTQSEINELFAVGGDDAGLVDDLVTRRLDALRLGVLQRIETMLIGMALDSFSYSRLGVIFSGLGWGVPSDLKVTTGTAWEANPTTATPVADILTLLQVARIRYGIKYNRMTMSTAAFRDMLATTEFQSKAKLYIPAYLGYANLAAQNLDQQQSLAEATLGLKIEFYDARYWSQAASGTIASAPFWPLNKIMLSDTGSDNNPMVQDFANGITTESRVGTLAASSNVPGVSMGGVIGSFRGAVRGPTGYASLEGMNPPQISMWGVARGWPRKHMLYANAILDVGSVTDSVSTSEPF